VGVPRERKRHARRRLNNVLAYKSVNVIVDKIRYSLNPPPPLPPPNADAELKARRSPPYPVRESMLSVAIHMKL
jgi:hypothetical protein